ncbi:unnamed protein product [Urochloa humidicola]
MEGKSHTDKAFLLCSYILLGASSSCIFITLFLRLLSSPWWGVDGESGMGHLGWRMEEGERTKMALRRRHERLHCGGADGFMTAAAAKTASQRWWRRLERLHGGGDGLRRRGRLLGGGDDITTMWWSIPW